MGILRQCGEIVQAKQPVMQHPTPFTRSAIGRSNLHRTAQGVAIQWFLERGYMVSLPVEVWSRS